MKKLSLRETKGITLIALIVSIIVLLILAGVTIAMLTGDNGILTNANNAKTANIYNEAEEKVKLAYMSVRTEIMAKRASNATYDATEHGTELASLAASELTGTEWTKCTYNSSSKTIEITYTSSAIKKDAISEGKPAQDGKADYTITLTANNATLALDVPEGTLSQNETNTGLWVNGTKISDYSADQLMTAIKENLVAYWNEETPVYSEEGVIDDVKHITFNTTSDSSADVTVELAEGLKIKTWVAIYTHEETGEQYIFWKGAEKPTEYSYSSSSWQQLCESGETGSQEPHLEINNNRLESNNAQSNGSNIDLIQKLNNSLKNLDDNNNNNYSAEMIKS